MTAAPQAVPITSGPRCHWFGYYDKLQFDATGRYVLGMEVDFEHRSPRPDDVIRVGMVDLADKNRWIELGESRAWCWQQGCMLQWRPGAESEVLWNDRQDDTFVCHIFDIKTGRRRTIPHPVYTLSPDGRTAMAPDFRRINDLRPGYGYCGLPDPWREDKTPRESGIWRIDLDTGKAVLIITLDQIARIPCARYDFSNARHWFNHLLFNTDGTRFEFLHRWRADMKTFNTRMFTADLNGRNIHVVDDYGETSHFIWRDPTHILAFAFHPSHGHRFYLYEDGTDKVEVLAKDAMPLNGHVSYLPDTDWILNDTYPDENRMQHLYLYHVPTDRRIPLGAYHQPPIYRQGGAGEWRCDLHPRSSRDGRLVTIDSTHEGKGRQMYLLDVGPILRAG
ncbi:MAG TPA: hypothetical protein P5137_16205 [Candidatus Brocadiia bacterium]|nr:hypothetical protein [Candidatus Brocadiia bacterium]